MTRPGTGSGEVLEVVVLYCQSCLADDCERIEESLHADGCRYRLVVQACSGKVELAHLLRLLERGADGVLVVGCAEDRCRFLIGSRAAHRRIDRARDLLEQAGISGDRVAMADGRDMHQSDLLALAGERAAALRHCTIDEAKGEAAS